MTACNLGPCCTYGQELVSAAVRSHPSTDDMSLAGAVMPISPGKYDSCCEASYQNTKVPGPSAKVAQHGQHAFYGHVLVSCLLNG